MQTRMESRTAPPPCSKSIMRALQEKKGSRRNLPLMTVHQCNARDQVEWQQPTLSTHVKRAKVSLRRRRKMTTQSSASPKAIYLKIVRFGNQTSQTPKYRSRLTTQGQVASSKPQSPSSHVSPHLSQTCPRRRNLNRRNK
jgi:hypothetical protein